VSVKGQLYHIGYDIGGNLGLAWLVEYRDWPLFSRWIMVWER
jgi:hypothetical protein